MTSTYAQSEQVKATWKRAYDDGHEVGNHTVQHLDGATYTADQWEAELSGCNEVLKTFMPADEIIGFRTPFLSYNDAELETVDGMGFHYDCSIEEGYEDKQDGTNFYWPYTLDNLSPGHTVQVSWGEGKVEINPHPGLWEIPVYAVFVPPDSKCEDYGVPSGLRAKLKGIQDWFDVDGGSITGFDYNLWAIRSAGGFEMTKAEFLASLKYTFDQHYNGNRAPFTLGAHTAYYVDSWSQNAPGASAARDRQEAIEEFIDYVKTKPGVKVTSAKELMEWVRNPSAL
jgi:peptidoglycan/xylan/chitin deacetylase (PgdA/CDA1 family)